MEGHDYALHSVHCSCDRAVLHHELIGHGPLKADYSVGNQQAQDADEAQAR